MSKHGVRSQRPQFSAVDGGNWSDEVSQELSTQALRCMTHGRADSTAKEGLGSRGKRKQVWAQSCREGVRQELQRRRGLDQTLEDNGLEGASGRCTRGKEGGQRNTGGGGAGGGEWPHRRARLLFRQRLQTAGPQAKPPPPCFACSENEVNMKTISRFLTFQMAGLFLIVFFWGRIPIP